MTLLFFFAKSVSSRTKNIDQIYRKNKQEQKQCCVMINVCMDKQHNRHFIKYSSLGNRIDFKQEILYEWIFSCISNPLFCWCVSLFL